MPDLRDAATALVQAGHGDLAEVVELAAVEQQAVRDTVLIRLGEFDASLRRCLDGDAAAIPETVMSAVQLADAAAAALGVAWERTGS